MDWQRIKRLAADFDDAVEKRKSLSEVDPIINDFLLTVCYCDARAIADALKEERKTILQRVHPVFRDDVESIAKMIIKGDIP